MTASRYILAPVNQFNSQVPKKLQYYTAAWHLQLLKKHQLTEFLLCVYRLPSPSAADGRFCQFPTIFRFIPPSTDQLVWLSGERKCRCVRFPSPVSHSRKGCVECEQRPELYAEFMHRVQQHRLSIWAEAKCGDVQMLPGAATQTQGPTDRPENSIASRKEQWHLLVEPHHGHFALAVITAPGLFLFGQMASNPLQVHSAPGLCSESVSLCLCWIEVKKSSSSLSFQPTNFLS